MGNEYEALNAMPAALNFYLCIACFGAFRLIISLEQNWEELRLWYHRRRHRRYLRAGRELRL